MGAEPPSAIQGARYEKKNRQLIARHGLPFIRHVLGLHRQGEFTAPEAALRLGVSRSRFYQLYSDYLRACATKSQQQWEPGRSGGDHRKPWPAQVIALVRKLLKATPPASYSFAASECRRRLDFRIDRASIRRFALEQQMAPDTRYKRKPAPVRRWQRQCLGELWQLDATPYRWFGARSENLPMLNMLDDCSRVITASRIYPREILLAYFDFLPRAFAAYGLPLMLYVDYHSFFFSQVPDALTQLGQTLKFYEISLLFAPTPQAKGKVERCHLYWQNRLPALFAAEEIHRIDAANMLIDELRLHHNAKEINRELRLRPDQAWQQALAENRTALRPAPKCPWWPYVWSQRTGTKVGSDGCVPITNLRLPVEQPPGTKVIRCLHADGSFTVLAEPPNPAKLPLVLLRFGPNA